MQPPLLHLFSVTQDDLSSADSPDSDRNSDSDSDAGGVRRDGGSGERDPLDRRETLVCDRLQKVIQAMTVLVGARLERKSIEKLVSSASRVFKAITKVSSFRFLFCFVLFIVQLVCGERQSSTLRILGYLHVLFDCHYLGASRRLLPRVTGQTHIKIS